MALIYLANKIQLYCKMVIVVSKVWLQVVHKPSWSHYLTDVLSWLPNSSEPKGVLDQTTYTYLFCLHQAWLLYGF
jgi:hypothetical protein